MTGPNGNIEDCESSQTSVERNSKDQGHTFAFVCQFHGVFRSDYCINRTFHRSRLEASCVQVKDYQEKHLRRDTRISSRVDGSQNGHEFSCCIEKTAYCISNSMDGQSGRFILDHQSREILDSVCTARA